MKIKKKFSTNFKLESRQLLAALDYYKVVPQVDGDGWLVTGFYDDGTSKDLSSSEVELFLQANGFVHQTPQAADAVIIDAQPEAKQAPVAEEAAVGTEEAGTEVASAPEATVVESENVVAEETTSAEAAIPQAPVAEEAVVGTEEVETEATVAPEATVVESENAVVEETTSAEAAIPQAPVAEEAVVGTEEAGTEVASAPEATVVESENAVAEETTSAEAAIPQAPVAEEAVVGTEEVETQAAVAPEATVVESENEVTESAQATMSESSDVPTIVDFEENVLSVVLSDCQESAIELPWIKISFSDGSNMKLLDPYEGLATAYSISDANSQVSGFVPVDLDGDSAIDFNLQFTRYNVGENQSFCTLDASVYMPFEDIRFSGDGVTYSTTGRSFCLTEFDFSGEGSKSYCSSTVTVDAL